MDDNKEIQKETYLYELLNFDEIDENIENEVISEISKIIEDVYNRKGGKGATVIFGSIYLFIKAQSICFVTGSICLSIKA